MKKVRLRMKEQEKYEVIKELVDHKGNKLRAAVKLNVTVRQINRLIAIYKQKGKNGFIHGNRNRRPVNSLSQELTKQIIELYNKEFNNFNFNHFKDKLHDEKNIVISYSCLYNLLNQNEIYSPKIQRATKRKIAKNKILKNKPEIKEDDLELAINHEVAIEDSHPRKERAKYFGEVIQMDASIHLWFGSVKTALHLAVDEATNTVVGAYFDYQETLYGYYNVFKQILTNYGIPDTILTDNRTVFNYLKDNFKKDHKDVLTQFGYACKGLGVSIITSSVSQAKGLIERDNGTFQGRLVNELIHSGIKDIHEANNYLTNIFVPDFNKRFALNINNFESIMEDRLTDEEANLKLSILSPRKFDNGSSIKYNNIYYQAYSEDDNLVCFKPKTKCLVIKTFDSKLYITVDEKIYKLKQYNKHKEISEEFDITKKVKTENTKRKVYIPPITHPWKRESFIKHQEEAHMKHKYA